MDKVIDAIWKALTMPEFWAGIITTSIIWLFKTLWNQYQESRKPDSHDLELWHKIDSILNQQHIDYWREHYVCDAFPEKLFSELDQFTQTFNYTSPQNKFLNNKLEERKLVLIKAANNFLKSICEAGTDNIRDRLKISRYENIPGKFEEIRGPIEDNATQMVKAYDDLKEIVIKNLINRKINL